jgi:hypothetical protein
MNMSTSRYQIFAGLGKSGRRTDVDRLMASLLERDDLATAKLVDFALGLVETPEGVSRLQHYLFEGVPCQRNYAALYFKRRGRERLVAEAYAQGLIDWEQAFLK